MCVEMGAEMEKDMHIDMGTDVHSYTANMPMAYSRYACRHVSTGMHMGEW